MRCAFGGTEEHLIELVLGVPERGTPTDGRFDRSTGLGWVRARTDFQYSDAVRRGNPVSLLVAESTGAASTAICDLFRALDKESRLSTSTDSTVYGIAPTSPRRFYAHHMAAHSAAIVQADAVTVHTAAAQLSLRLSLGLTA